MLKLEIFDPPMCCATGICGSSVDPTLVTFASDLEWLKKKGIDVVRYGLSFEPAEFVKNDAVKNLLNSEGNSCLPILVINTEVILKGRYPSRAQLADICKINYDEEEAPPVHREENCCCGVDCDCRSSEDDKDAASSCNCSNAPAEDNCFCGPNCVCHTHDPSDKWKKIIFVVFMIIILAIIAAKFWGKAGAAESVLANINSISQIKASQEVAYVYIPTKSNEKISSDIKGSMISAQNTLKSKNIDVSLYSISTNSAGYAQVASKTTPPSVLTIYKGKGQNYVSGAINPTRLLQSYIAATRDGGCGAGCPCHKKH